MQTPEHLSDAVMLLLRRSTMQSHKDAVIAALAGFVLTGSMMAPPILSARAEKAASIAAYDQELGPRVTSFGNYRAGRLAYLLRDLDGRKDSQGK